MKLSKQQEKSMMQVYSAYLDNYLKGDVEAIHPLLDNNYTQVGSAESEVFNNKKDAVQFLYDTIDQVSGKLEMRNRVVKMGHHDHTILIREVCDLYALADKEWIFYSKFRVSTLMQEKKDGWKLVHQHSSFPDSRTEEGQNIAIDKIAEENIQLREAVKRRTIELEQKNNDLLMEVALEKVRSRTMAMHNSSELAETTAVLHEQLLDLGIQADRTIIAFPDEVAGAAEFWSTNQGGTKIDHQFKTDLTEPHQGLKTLAGWKKKLKSIVIQLEGEELTTLLNYYRGKVGLPISRQILTNTSRDYTSAYFSHGWITLVTPEPLSNEKINILERFAAVFNLTYTRFLDLQKAEAQAREAKIETSLEKVRSRSMAMHHSSDLPEVLKVVAEELTGLGLKFDQASFAKINQDGSWEIWLSTPEKSYPAQIHVPYLDHLIFNSVNGIVADGADFHTDIYSYEEKNRFFNHIFQNTIAQNIPEARKQYVLNSKGFARSVILTKNIWLSLGNYEAIPYTSEDNFLLKRFATVFEQSYTRFLDLQKAEAQTREAKIETALEKVRSRSLAMHHSDELKEVITVVLKKLQELGIEMDKRSAVIFVFEQGSKDYIQWAASPGHASAVSLRTPYFEHPIQTDLWNEREMGNNFFVKTYSLQEKNSLFQHFFEHTDLRDLPKEEKKWILDSEHYALAVAFEKNSALAVATFSGILLTVSESEILKRFARVFEQSYIRFLDLQRAEAQTRESLIELGLERVRARAMAMQNSEELKELISTVFAELTKLDLVLTRCLIMIYDPKTNGSTWWMANSEAPSDSIGLFVQYHEQPPYLAYIKAWQQRNLKWQYILEGKVKKQWDDFLFNETELSDLPDFIIAGMKAPDSVYLNASFNNFGNLTLASLEPLSDEQFDILLRFAKVFDLTYTRFNDLKQAEAQAREAQIELGLERVRARAMAMQKSEEFLELIEKIYSELQNLGFNALNADLIIFTEDKKGYDIWVSGAYGAEGPYRIPEAFFSHPHHLGTMNSWIKGDQMRITELNGDKFTSFFELVLDDAFGLRTLTRESKNKLLSLGQIIHTEVFTKHGCIRVGSVEPRAEGQLTIQKRFAQVFDQTYTRFLDLKKAEAQAREATIEAALERVRSRTMAMHSSQDVGDTAIVIFDELEKLGVATNRCGIIKFEDKGYMEVWTAGLGVNFAIRGRLDTRIHQMLAQGYRAWKNKEATFSYFLQGSDLTDYYAVLNNAPEYPYQMPDTPPSAQAISLFFFPEGALYAFTPETLSNEAVRVFSRFAAAFALTYRRYLDLMVAEQQTRQVVQQSSLDRVRAEIASMRTTADLENITPLIWHELTTLGVPFIRCGVFIMDEENKQIQTFLSTPDGKAIAAFKLPFTTPGTPAQALAHWRKKEIFTDYWDEAAFKKWTANLVDQGVIAFAEQYSSEHSPANLHLYFLPFLQGMLYVGSEIPLGDDEINVAQTLANAFSTAYSRFDDFNKLELAKHQIEKTLVDLKLAQSQLIQSEKMASLGELTAGIAHEIQNPLNFVNNFSEVSMELIEEVKSEKLKTKSERSEELENELLDDIAENLQKISHHGKRADFIVKGMLQHSRTSTGEKQTTNINTLAEEFLKLSYHGLRAKDKSFNAELVTNFDKNLPQINVVQQDIGRVLLNLFNNAFYAVNERKKSKEQACLPVRQGAKNKEEYKPIVEVSTSSKDGYILISVRDNGSGIPEGIKEKIMQPFFTTKPTGEGTGLGLSLSYDIVKAHGGEIKSESKQGEGSIFTVQLPS